MNHEAHFITSCECNCYTNFVFVANAKQAGLSLVQVNYDAKSSLRIVTSKFESQSQ